MATDHLSFLCPKLKEDDIMATPKKLPSGQWRTQVYDYTDEGGKRHYRSFTASTKKMSALMAAEFAAHRQRLANGDLTIGEAVDHYIDSKQNVLSPSTVRGYVGIRKNNLASIENMSVRRITTQDVQIWVNQLSKKLSPKSVANAYGLLVSAITFHDPDHRIRATLPKKKKADLYCPSDEDIKRLINHVAGRELEIAIYLAAFGPMRRGEICALTSDDIHGNVVRVNKSMVLDSDGHWVIKQPKTYSSYRDIIFPDFVIAKLSGINGRIIQTTPNQLSARFRRAICFSGSPHFRFHDLRHYSASIMHAIGVPDQYIMQRGGWATDGVMKTVYRNTIDSITQSITGDINQHFEDVISHDISHNNIKSP